MKLVATIGIILQVVQHLSAQDCLSRNYGNGGTVCVCNSDHCDTIAPIKKLEGTKYVKFTSNKAGLRFHKEEGSFTKEGSDVKNVITVGTKMFQEIIGFGGAFSDSTGINIKSLNKDLQDKLIRSYFSDEGIEYSVGRVPIGGTDFSIKGYSYCDTENDTVDLELNNWKLASADTNYKIPLIKEALKLRNNEFDLLASAWIAPNWMKTKPGFLERQSFIKDEMYQVWANYLVKFLMEYNKQDISFWGITTGNEPLTAYLPNKIPSVAWTVDGQKKWIRENFGPTLKNSNFNNTKIIIVDDQILLLPIVPDQLLADKKVEMYVDGIGIHWYLEIGDFPELLDITHKNHPNVFMLATEACNGYVLNDVELGNWYGGESYADNIIKNLNHWVIGWIDWNMALDVEGGPTFIGNNVDSPIIVNATAQEFYKQPMYYAMGHFSKFIPKGSVRIESSQFSKNSDVLDIAFRRPDGGTTVIVLNKAENDISSTVRDPRKGDITMTLTANSITSIVYW